jgi:DNA-binding NarL/FixJ family response regulator
MESLQEIGRNMALIRTLLVDDSREFLQAASQFLSVDPQIEIVGKFLSTREALDNIYDLNPDLVLMDLAMPHINGLEATQLIKEHAQPPKVIILTMHDNPEYRHASNAVQADGFITKSNFGVELIPLIEEIFKEQMQPEGQDQPVIPSQVRRSSKQTKKSP